MGSVRLADDFFTRRNVGNARQPASTALAIAEKLRTSDFGWRSASSAAISGLPSAAGFSRWGELPVTRRVFPHPLEAVP